jgi:hypothetical protein
VLVCGNAWCLLEDIEGARAIYPDAPAIAVNGASGNVKAMALFSMHPQKLPVWADLQRRKFGAGFTVHGRCKEHVYERNRRKMPWVEYWWQDCSGATSTWAARKIAAGMGFDQVILCGMPLEKGGYQGGKIAKDFMRDDVLAHYRRLLERDKDWHEGVTSMSGWTAEFLGRP